MDDCNCYNKCLSAVVPWASSRNFTSLPQSWECLAITTTTAIIIIIIIIIITITTNGITTRKSSRVRISHMSLTISNTSLARRKASSSSRCLIFTSSLSSHIRLLHLRGTIKRTTTTTNNSKKYINCRHTLHEIFWFYEYI